MQKKKAAFTLIELLVVVLIIGILAAIALPQYQIAVEKSRIAEANIILKSVTDACERYYLANPGDDSFAGCSWGNMDISLNLQYDGDYEMTGKYFMYSTEESSIGITAWRLPRLDTPYILSHYYEEQFRPYPYTRSCTGFNDFGKKVCKSLCGANSCDY